MKTQTYYPLGEEIRIKRREEIKGSTHMLIYRMNARHFQFKLIFLHHSSIVIIRFYLLACLEAKKSLCYTQFNREYFFFINSRLSIRLERHRHWKLYQTNKTAHFASCILRRMHFAVAAAAHIKQ